MAIISFLLRLIFLIPSSNAYFFILPVFVILNAIYFSYFESTALKATPGKYFIGLYVIDENGCRLSGYQAFFRFLGKIVSFFTFGYGFIIIAFKKNKQGLHDRLTKTTVLRKYE